MIPAHKDTIMIHCLATPPSWGETKSAAQAAAEVRLWHTRDRGWSDIAYAMVFGYRGDRAKGRDLDRDGDVWEETGAGARGWNTNCIHLALVGGRWPDLRWGLRTDRFEDHFTPEQDRALRKAIREIQQLAGRPMKVIGHNEVDPGKGCPAFDVPTWYARDKSQVRNPVADALTGLFQRLGLGQGGPA